MRKPLPFSALCLLLCGSMLPALAVGKLSGPSLPRLNKYVVVTNEVAGNPAAAPNPTSSTAVRGELLVRFKANVGRARQQALLTPWATKVKFFRPPNVNRLRLQARAPGNPSVFDQLALVRLGDRVSLHQALQHFRKHPDVLYAEPNYRLQVTQSSAAPVIPNDFDFAQLWGLHNVGQADGLPGADIHMADAWRYTTGDKRIIVAVIDTGIDYFHPDLAANIWTNPGETAGNGLDDDGNGFADDVHGYDFVSDDGDPLDDLSHGTHVAGTIGAVGNNEIGIAGVCWKVSLMAVKVFDETGNGEIDTAIEGIRYAMENGARIINASWGSYDKSRALEEVLNEVYQAGIVFVAAAGNDNSSNEFYPAAYDHVIAVAATTAKDQRARFSNYGPYVTVAAPGENIYSTIPNNSYEFYSGTSMAAPHVTGTAALILAEHPEFGVDEVVNIIRNSVDLIPGDLSIGTGRINAAMAMQVQVPLPQVKLTLPTTAFGNIDIPGTATGNNFVHYTLEYGTGSDPTNWTAFYSSPTPVSGGTLFRDFSTPVLGDGLCTFRLTAENAAGERAVERVVVQISNVHVRFPLDNDILRAGDSIKILGTVFGGNRSYTLEYGTGPNPTTWTNTGVTLTDGGTSPVMDGVLATWDTSQVTPNQFYTLKLSARADDNTVTDYLVRLVYLDDHLKPGWPQYLPVVGDFPPEDWRDVQVADIDKDGQDEIILVDHGNSDGQPARLLVYRNDGSLYWSKNLGSGYPYADVPVIGDIEGDGFLEIFVEGGSDNNLYAFRFDGSPLPGKWPVHLDATSLAKVLADVDGDGRKELIGYSQDTVQRGGADYRQLVVYDAQGNLMRNWQIPACSAEVDAPRVYPAVANLDGDPDLEIVAIWGCETVAAFKMSKASGPLWTASSYGTLATSPVIGDLDHDGTNEVVVAAYDLNGTDRGGVYVFDHNGKRLSGWPVLLNESFTAAPVLADLDGDGFLEISVPCKKSGLLHLLRRDGFEVSGWPVGPVSSSSFRSSPSIGDIDGDGRLDVVLNAPGYMSLVVSSGDVSQAGGIKAWNFAGQPISLTGSHSVLPLVMESSVGPSLKGAPPVLADVDHNGRLDIVAASVQDRTYLPLGEKSNWKKRSSIYVWELDAPYAPERLPWPMSQANLEHTGSYPTPKRQDQPPVVSAIPNQIIRSGTSFFPIELDEYVEDPDNALNQLTWTATGNQDLIVTMDANRVATVRVPDRSWAGKETIHFTATDPAGLSNETSATFEARPDYVGPTTGSDRASTLEDTAIEIDVLANDIDPSNNPLAIAGFSKPRLGKVTQTPDGTLLYTPKPDANGTDTFSYIVTDGKGGMSLGSVTVEITPVNDPPVANLDRVVTDEDLPVEIDVLANDSDPDGDPLTLIDFTLPTNGTLVLQADNRFLYVPATNYFGLDSFTYTIADPQGATNQGSVDIMVEPVNDPPVAQSQSFTLNRNSSQNINFLADDPDDTEFTFTVVDSPLHGSLWSYPKVATYYPTNGFVGTDSFTYRANDGKADGPIATVNLTVLDTNNVPEADGQSVVTKVNQSVAITLMASDLDFDPLTYEIVNQPAKGTLTGKGTNYIYRPNTDFLGKDSFTFKAFDGKDSSPLATVQITVTDQNTPPTAEDFTVHVLPNTPTNITLRATDPEANPLNFHVASRPAHGKLTGKGADLIYSPNAFFQGSDRFTFTADDGEFESNVGTVSLTIEDPNRAPVATNQQVIVFKNTATAIQLEVKDADADFLNCPILKGPKNGRISGLGTILTYTPKTDFEGSDTFTYKAWDGHVYSGEGKVSISVMAKPQEPPLRFQSVEVLDDHTVRLVLRALATGSVQVLASTDLMNWTLLGPPVPATDPVSITDTNAVAGQQRFYRATIGAEATGSQTPTKSSP